MRVDVRVRCIIDRMDKSDNQDTQEVPAEVLTELTFESEPFDKSGLHEANPSGARARLYAPRDGRYATSGGRTVDLKRGEPIPED